MFAEEIRELFPALIEIEELVPRTQPQRKEWQIPDRFGDFRIVREIGRGGMGIVYAAEQESLGRHVALKVLPLAAGKDATQRERFHREARSAAQLHHTNIVPVFAVGEEKDIPFYAMQYIHGCGLHEVLKALDNRSSESSDSQWHDMTNRLVDGLLSGNLIAAEPTSVVSHEQPDGNLDDTLPNHPNSPSSTVTEVLSEDSPAKVRALYFRAVARISIQVAEALSYAHSQGVLHRDIKPSNLHLDTRGTVWVMDFGLAKTEGLPDLTETGTIAGTLRYLPPERFDGIADTRSDTYGLGLTLYELLTLRPAFDANDRSGLMQQVMEAHPASPRQIDPRIPRDLETITLKCLRKEPQGRYATVKDLAEDLRRFLAGEPIFARRPNFGERGLMWMRRKPALAAAMFFAAMTVMAIVAFGVIFFFNRQLEDALARESKARLHADAAEEKAKSAQGQTKVALAKVRDLYYINNIVLAQREWQNDNIGKALQLLDECPADRRHWEWHYLRRCMHPSTPSLIHSTGVNYVGFRNDGQHIFTRTSDGTFRTWDGKTLRELKTFNYPNSPKSSVLSPDHKYFATYWFQKGAVLNIYETKTGQLIKSLPIVAYGVTFCPDGLHLAFHHGKNYEVWNWKDGIRVFRGNGKPSFSPGGVYFASSWNSALKSYVRIRKVKGGELLKSLESQPDSAIRTVRFSPSGKYVSRYSTKLQAMEIWDWRANQLVSTLKQFHFAGILAWSPDDIHLAVSDSYAINIWDWRKSCVVRRLESHTKQISSLAYSPDGKTLASASSEKLVRLWDLSRPEPIIRFLARNAYWFRFSPDGRLLISQSGDNQIQIRDADTGQILEDCKVLNNLTCCSFTQDGKQLLAVCEGKLHDLRTGKILRMFADDFHPVHFSINGRYLIGNYGNKVTGRGTRTLDLVAKTFLPNIPSLYLQKDPPFSKATALSGDGHSMAVAFGLDRIVVAETRSGRRIYALTCPPNQTAPKKRTAIRHVSLNHDGSLLAVAHEGRALLWNLHTGKLFRAFSGSINYVALHPDGKRLAVNSSGGVSILDISSGQQLLFLKLPGGPRSDLTGLVFSPDGKRLAAMNIMQEIMVWNADTTK